MGWLARLKRTFARDPAEPSRDTFVPRDWARHFRGLTREERRAAASRLCQKALDVAEVGGDDVERVMVAIARGQIYSDELASIGALVERFEGEYDRLVGDDEAKLIHSDLEIRAAFVKARAATALKCALEGRLTRMAYEAWFVLDDLVEVWRLASKQPPAREPES